MLANLKATLTRTVPATANVKATDVRTVADVFANLKPYFETVAMGKVSASALEATDLKLAREDDSVVFNPYELLHVARETARALAAAGWRR